MPNVVATISDDRQIPGSDTETIEFAGVAPGQIVIKTRPGQKVKLSDTGTTGTLVLRRPGSTAAVATKVGPLNVLEIALGHQATAPEVATPGSWTCEVTNGANQPMNWHTDIQFVTAVPVQSASFDLGLLNFLLAASTDAIGLHVQLRTSEGNTEESSMTWTDAVAAHLGGSRGRSFHLSDFSVSVPVAGDLVFRVENLETVPEFPVVTALPGLVQVVIRFQPETAQVVCLDLPVRLVDFTALEVTLEIGFNGTVTASWFGQMTVEVGGFDVDVADVIGSAIVGSSLLGSNGALADLISATSIRHTIDAFVIRLMRLGEAAHVEGYRFEGDTLFVEYSTPS